MTSDGLKTSAGLTQAIWRCSVRFEVCACLLFMQDAASLPGNFKATDGKLDGDQQAASRALPLCRHKPSRHGPKRLVQFLDAKIAVEFLFNAGRRKIR